MNSDIWSSIIGVIGTLGGTIIGFFLSERGKKGKIMFHYFTLEPEYSEIKREIVFNLKTVIVNTSMEPKVMINLRLSPYGFFSEKPCTEKLIDISGNQIIDNTQKLGPREHLTVNTYCKVSEVSPEDYRTLIFYFWYTNEKGNMIKEQIGYG